MEKLVYILKEATDRLPQLRYAWGLLGVAATAAIITSILGEGKATIIIVAVTIIGLVLIFITMVALGSATIATKPAATLIWSITVFFVIFLGFTISAFAWSWPCNWVNFIELEVLECGHNPNPDITSVDIKRTSDFRGSGCVDGNKKLVYKVTDDLTFSEAIKIYRAQAGTTKNTGEYKLDISYLKDGETINPITPAKRVWPQIEQKTVDIPVNGKELQVIYKYSPILNNKEDNYGVGFISSLPIKKIVTEVILPDSKEVLMVNDKYDDDNNYFQGCDFKLGNNPKLSCENFEGEANKRYVLHWIWDVYNDC
ncbi:hypothetical protein [Marinobacterium rhizophilum]|uniref:hypothetical protein n=1 Tax=Marinobacterium rhizophilum TaxID=420402 RepID=UPI0012EC74FB|nr:hypothetical protein [Marinobacterium rhizophilum]